MEAQEEDEEGRRGSFVRSFAEAQKLLLQSRRVVCCEVRSTWRELACVRTYARGSRDPWSWQRARWQQGAVVATAENKRWL